MRGRFPHTLPVWPVDVDGHCTCYFGPACKRPGKHADERAPDDSPSYAVLCGPGGVLVVDVDTKGGVDGYAQLEGWELPATFEVHTPSGGRHLYFTHPGGDLANRKLDSAIDVRANPRSDGGHAYVIGPGSPGYTKTSDPTVVVPAEPYEVAEDAPFAAAPENLIAWLSIGADRGEGFAPTPVDVDTPLGQGRLAKGEEAAKSMAPSKADGEGGRNLFNVCLRLVRTLELPVDVAHALIVEHFNPRCTDPQGHVYPWSDDEIRHKLEDARDKSSIPTGLSEGIADKMRAHLTPEPLRNMSTSTKGRKVHDPAHSYTYKAGNIAATGEPARVPFNEIVGALARGHEWIGVWQYDEFARRVVCVDPPIRLDAETSGLSETDIANIRSVLEFSSISATKEDVHAAILSAASEARFHPVREYFEGLPLTGDTSVLSGLAGALFGASDPMSDIFVRKFLIASVRRILTPGCKVDTMLVLYGKQGFKKSTCLEVLFGKQWFKDDLADLESKDAAIGLTGRRIVEVAELDKILRAETSTVKAFLSRAVDRYRPPYGRVEVEIPRECVFCGTTNEEEFQRDPTGGRRFWPIHVRQKVDLEWLDAHRDEIWGAALHLAKSGEPHWLDDLEEEGAEEVREHFSEADAWHEDIEGACTGRAWVRAEQIYVDTICNGEKEAKSKLDRKILLRVTATLKRLGCVKGMVYEGDKRVRAWVVPEALASKARPKARVFPIRA